MTSSSDIPPLSNFSGILFDLDGTLVDSVPDIANSCNVLLYRYNYAPLSLDQVRSMIGNGLRKLVERAFEAVGESLISDTLDERTSEMMDIYERNLTKQTRPMSGANELLSYLSANQFRLAIVTNKPKQFSQKIVESLDWLDAISCIVGGDSCPNRKPAPDMLIHACQSLSLRVDSVLMIGDSPADIEAARASSIACVAVRGGYTDVPADELGADWVVDSLECLL